MNEKKPSIKLFTWKHGIYTAVAFVLGIALAIYRVKVYLDTRELVFLIVPITIALATLVIILAYYANRSEKGK